MLQNLLKNLTQPFPYTRGIYNEALTILIVCGMVVVIIHFMNPSVFELLSFENLMFFGLIAFVSVVFNLLFGHFILKRIINEDQWVVWKEIVKSLFYLYVNTIALLYFISQVTLHVEFSSIFQFAFYAFAFAIIPIGFRVNRIHIWLLKKRLEQVEKLNKVIDKKENQNLVTPITIKSNIVNDLIETSSEELVYIKAEHNYVKVFLLKNQEIKPILLRITITRAFEQISNSQIVQCHRSYIVNLRFILKATGNSKGLKLILKRDIGKIPVSKSFIESFINYSN